MSVHHLQERTAIESNKKAVLPGKRKSAAAKHLIKSRTRRLRPGRFMVAGSDEIGHRQAVELVFQEFQTTPIARLCEVA